MVDDVKSKILRNIQKTGFPLELRVSKLLEDRGYYVANNLYYVDLTSVCDPFHRSSFHSA